MFIDNKTIHLFKFFKPLPIIFLKITCHATNKNNNTLTMIISLTPKNTQSRPTSSRRRRFAAGWSCELLLRRSATSRHKAGVHVFLSPSPTSLLYQISWRSDVESESEEISVFWVYESGHDGGREWWWSLRLNLENVSMTLFFEEKLRGGRIEEKKF